MTAKRTADELEKIIDRLNDVVLTGPALVQVDIAVTELKQLRDRVRAVADLIDPGSSPTEGAA